MVMNLTDIEFLEIHKQIVIPNIVILFLFIFFIFLIVGLLSVRKSRGKFMTIWIISLIFSLVGLGFLTFLPSITQKIIETFN